MSPLARLARLRAAVILAADRYQTGVPPVVARLGRVYRRFGVRPKEALRDGLADPRIPLEQLDGAITKLALLTIQRRANPEHLPILTEDKALFYPLCEAAGIPVPKTYAVCGHLPGWIPGRTITSREEWEGFFERELPTEFVTKPATGVYGDQVRVIRRERSGFTDGSGWTGNAAALYDVLTQDSKYDRYVIQEQLHSHPDLVSLSGSPYLLTARLITYAETGGHAEIGHHFFKVVVGENVSDNFHWGKTGNLLANCALETGVLGAAFTFAKDGVGLEVVPQHPVTKELIEGFRLPLWQEAKELALRCARLFLPLRTVGWDIALTPSGAVVVEGNAFWDPVNALLAAPKAAGMPTLGISALLRKIAPTGVTAK